jgi:glycosyltransferase involved in cell wall biosynthesis
MISVLIPTYNQEEFILQTIESVTNQTISDVEILVGNDASTDRTVDIVRNICNQDRRIKIFDWKKNEGGLKNIDKLLQRCSGDFVIILEGDDYWLDNKFLEKAQKILHDNDGFSFVASRFYKGKVDSGVVSKFYGKVDVKILSLGNFIQLGTVLFRKKFLSRIHPQLIHLPLGDYPMFMKLLEYSPGYIIKDPCFFYRIHKKGIWSMQNKVYQIDKTIETIQAMKKILKSNYLFNFQIDFLLLKKIYFSKNIPKNFNLLIVLNGIILIIIKMYHHLIFLISRNK